MATRWPFIKIASVVIHPCDGLKETGIRDERRCHCKSRLYSSLVLASHLAQLYSVYLNSYSGPFVWLKVMWHFLFYKRAFSDIMESKFYNHMTATVFVFAGDLTVRGVSCVFDNASIARSVSLLLLCCLPSQLPDIATDIRPALPPHTIIVSLVSATPVAKLCQLLGTTNVLRPDATAMMPPAEWNWDITVDIEKSLGTGTTLEKTCPLSSSKQGDFI